jgi:hypothetical protein
VVRVAEAVEGADVDHARKVARGEAGSSVSAVTDEPLRQRVKG